MTRGREPGRGFRRCHNPGREYCFEAPAQWEVAHHPEHGHMVQAGDPESGATMTVAVYAPPPGGSLREFADIRFAPGAREPFLHPVGEERAFPGGYYLETEGCPPGGDAPGYYVIGVVELPQGGGFASCSILTSREEFERNRARYVRMMRSVRRV